MCGRFTLHHSTEEVAQRFAVQKVLFEIPPRYNIAPTQPVATVRENGSRTLEAVRWGLVPFWAKDPQIGIRLMNARAETLAEKPAFRYALARRRCLIPADGFYEWRPQGKGRQPIHVRRRDAGLFAFAGLWEEWKPPDGPPLRTGVIITVPPNDLMAPIHHRMPAILTREQEALWLDASIKNVAEILSLLRPYPAEEMEAYPVSKRVNAPTVDDLLCIEPLSPE